MERETRSLWWIMQGSIVWLMSLIFGQFWLGILLFGVHGVGAFCSQYIQGED